MHFFGAKTAIEHEDRDVPQKRISGGKVHGFVGSGQHIFPLILSFQHLDFPARGALPVCQQRSHSAERGEIAVDRGRLIAQRSKTLRKRTGVFRRDRISGARQESYC